jgi:hypothetical protein
MQDNQQLEAKETKVLAGTQLQTMLHEVKRSLKPHSKNELIRIVSALLLENFNLKQELTQLQAPQSESKENGK